VETRRDKTNKRTVYTTGDSTQND